MTIGILGKKLGMTQLFQEDGTWIPVTVVQAGPCKVLQVKVAQTSDLPEESRTGTLNRGKKHGKVERPRRADGYYGVQLGFDEKPAKAATKAETGHVYGCPIGNLSQEMGDLSPSFQHKLKGAMDSMVDIYAGLIQEAQKSGEVSRLLDAGKAADFLVSSWEGALIRMKIEKSPEPLENHQQFIFRYILTP